jgi:hypothetical protein
MTPRHVGYLAIQGQMLVQFDSGRGCIVDERWCCEHDVVVLW